LSSPYVGEIRLFPWGWAPYGWQLCAGQTLPIQQYAALFSLIGTYYGGNGTTTFQLPDTRGRTVVHYGNGSEYTMGEPFGTETVALNSGEMPMHTHQMKAASGNGQPQPNGHAYGHTGTQPAAARYAPDSGALVALMPTTVSVMGSGQPHDNMQPYLVLNYCIAMQGAFPPRN
jgi:microcystin-dependent protein